MLTINNIEKLKNRPLNKRNFYVESIHEQFSVDNITLTASEHRYKITITNRTYAITITLDRYPIYKDCNSYRLSSSMGHYIYIALDDIKNIDKFINKLRYVGLTQFR